MNVIEATQLRAAVVVIRAMPPITPHIPKIRNKIAAAVIVLDRPHVNQGGGGGGGAPYWPG